MSYVNDLSSLTLETNPMFQSLKSKFKMIYDEVSKNLYTICIPIPAALENLKLTRDFIQLHSLRESPFYKGEYVTLLDEDLGLIVDRLFITLHRGWKERQTVQILHTEVFYNEEYKPFYVHVITAQFSSVGSLKSRLPTQKQIMQRKTFQKAKLRITQMIPNRITVESSSKFWSDLLKEDKKWVKFNEKLKTFKNCYVLTKKFEKYASARVQQLFTAAVTNFIEPDVVLRGFLPRSHLGRGIRNTLRVYILGELDYWPKLVEFYQNENEICENQMNTLQSVPTGIIGIAEHFVLDFKKAIKMLKKITQVDTAMEKILVIDTTIMSLSEIIEEKLGSGFSLATDDLIPIFTFILIKAKVPHLYSTAIMIEHFNLCNTTSSKYGFEITLIDSIIKNLIFEKKLFNLWQKSLDEKGSTSVELK
ncbi:ankyrin repeat domain-containing protein [Anaeramoeba flamelloides]|uniref:Ankyrin repeat domain-containing protein n=1 Tax=Anaeramoeba flamelloides TaxID=1746091 RepID=A0ABQ8XJF5_9EUKA|nr:ankyrin repeat domain-containing protein [Anaeramoeba flamelloides]